MSNITKEKGLDGLKLLDFPVVKVPVFLALGEAIGGHRAIVRPDTGVVLGLVSDQYELVSHRQSLDPYIARLGKEGWTVNEVRLERGGAKVYVELHNKFETRDVKVGDPVGRRLVVGNSYDGSTAATCDAKLFCLKCLNGAVAPRGTLFSSSLRHSGDVHENIDEASREFAFSLDNTVEVYRGLADKTVSNAIAKAVIQEVCGIRKLDLVTAHWTRDGHNGSTDSTGWTLYNAITYYLTHEFGGALAARERKNDEALDLLTHPEKVRQLIDQQAREKAAQN